MGLFSRKKKKKPDASDITFAVNTAGGAIGFGSSGSSGSSGSTADMWKSLGFQVNDFRSETEKNAEKSAGIALEEPLEQYAKDIVSAFATYDGNSMASDNATKAKVRPIGEKLDNNERQLRVFHRAVHLGNARNIRINTSAMERFWEGFGGWQS